MTASLWVVVFALLVRVLYVPYHLAVDEHHDAHAQHAAAEHAMVFEVLHACEDHPEVDPAQGHEHPQDPGHPPHAAEDHDTELMQVRSSAAHAPLTQIAVLEAETWRLVLRQAHLLRPQQAQPVHREHSRGVLIARGPPATV